MIKSKKVRLVFVLVLLLGFIDFGQDGLMYTIENQEEEIISIYKSKGETGLRDFLKVNIDAVDNYLIRTFSERGVTEKNEDLLKVALIIAEEKKNEKFIALVHSMMGRYFFSIDNYEKMFDYFEKVLPVIEKINDPETREYMKMLKKMIDIFKKDYNSEFDKIIDELSNFYIKQKNSKFEGDLYIGEGSLFSMKGDSINAFKCFEKALTFFKSEGNLDGQGKVYTLKGMFYSFNDDKVRAIEMYDNALFFFEKTGNREEIIHIYILIGDIYRYTGERAKAIEMYNNALSLFENSEDSSGMARIYLLIGDIHLRNGEETKSIAMFDQALNLFEKGKNYLVVSDVYYEKGGIYFLNGDYTNALKMIEFALSFSEKSGNYFERGYIYETMGAIYAAKGDNLKALEMFEKALTFHKKIGHLRSLSFALFGKAKGLAEIGKKDDARPLFEEAIEKFENLRRLAVFPWMKRTFMENVYDQYAEVAIFMLENKYSDKGFKYAEAMKARIFVDQMAEGFVKVEKGLLPELKEKRNNLILKLSAISKQMAETVRNDEEKPEGLNEQFVKLENEFKFLLEKIRLKNPQYAAVQYPEPVTLPDLQKKILKQGELLLQYLVTKEKTYVFLISKEDFQVIPLDIREEEIKAKVNRYFLPFNKEASRKKFTI